MDIYENFIDKVMQMPNEIMFFNEEESVTYMQAYQMVEKCAQKIQHHVKGHNNRILLYLSHSYKIIIGILSVLKTGNSYIPVRIEKSKDDVKEIADIANSNVIISDGMVFDNILTITYGQDNYEDVKVVDSTYYQYDKKDEVYVLFTSGSTGIPKGVSVTYGNLLYIMENMIEISACTKGSTYIFSTPYAFDVSVTEIYAFMYGAKIFVADLTNYDQYKRFPECIVKNHLTHFAVSPSGLKNMILTYSKADLIKMFHVLECVMVAGEAFKKEISDFWEENHLDCRILNLYGPTEATVYATGYELCHGEDYTKGIPIGKPLKGCYYVIDNQGDDEVGELLLGGTGIADGYINNETENKKRFVSINDRVYYRTGDLVSEKQGVLLFHGRNDDQIQINGIRVELGEIESKLLEVQGIREAVVTYYNNILYGTVCLELGSTLESREIKELLEKKVPKYMVPNIIRLTDKISLNANNKIDRKKIEREIIEECKSKQKRNEVLDYNYLQLLNIMQKCLGEDFAIHSIDDDFYECGGDSLSTILLISKIEKHYNRNLNSDLIYNLRTARKIVDYIRENDDTNDSVVSSFDSKIMLDLIPLSQEVYQFLFSNCDKVEQTYEALQLQEFYYNKKIKNTIYFDYDVIISETCSQLDITRAIKELICQNPILNSGLAMINNQLTFREFSNDSLTAIPLITLSSFDDNVITYMIESYRDLLFYSRQNGGRMALFVVVICNDRAKIISLFDHCIGDASSISLIKLKFSNLINGKKQNTSKQYREYCKLIQQKNSSMKGVLDSWYIKELQKCKVNKESIGCFLEKTKIIEENLPKNEDSIGISIYISYIIAQKLIKLFDREFISVRVQLNLRDYEGYDFKETLGDMHVSVALVYQNGESYEAYLNQSKRIIELYSKQFFRPSYLAKNSRIDDRTSQLELAKIGMDADIVSINYLGMFEKQEMTEFLSDVTEMQYNLINSSKRIYITAASDDEKIYICSNSDI